MTNFDNAKNAIINHIASLSNDDKAEILNKLERIHILLKEEDRILARYQLANILTLLMKMIPSNMVSELVRSFTTFIIFITMLERYRPNWGIYQPQKVINAHCTELKQSILLLNQVTKEQVLQKINIIETNIQHHIEKYQSRMALAGGAVGHIVGVFVGYTSPVSQLGIFKPIAQGVLSNLGYGFGAEKHYYYQLAQQRSGQRQPGLSINDFLITIRGFMTNIDGFTASINDLTTDEAKQLFIQKCMHLVDKGCDSQFKQLYPASLADDSFIRDKMDVLLNKPLISIFANRTDLKERDIPVIRLFTRLQLYRLLFELAEANQNLIDINWLTNAKKRLENEFNEIAKQQQLTFQGRVLRNQQDIKSAIVLANEDINNFHRYFPIIAALALVYYITKPLKNTMPSELNIPITLAFLFISLYLNRYGYKARDARVFLNNDVRAAENRQRVISDDNVLKFYFVKDESLQKLEESYVRDSNRQKV